MKKIFLLISLLLAAVTVNAEMQQGYTKTRGKLDAKGQLIPGQRLSGVIVETDRGKVTSEKDGAFSLAIPNGKFVLKKVDLNGYILNDFEQLRQYNCSATPLALVLVKPEEYSNEKVKAIKKINRSLQRTLLEREEEIDALYEQNKISEQEKDELYKKLSSYNEKNQKLVEELAERYAKTDFDQIDEFQRLISEYIIKGELSKADSLLNKKGNTAQALQEIRRIDEINQNRQKEIDEEQAQLDKSKAYATKLKEDLALWYYRKHEIFLLKHQNDSAAYYLELRSNIDTTNVQWNIDAGDFAKKYLSEFERSLDYYQRALRHCKSKDFQSLCFFNMAILYSINFEIDKALEYYEKSLQIRLAIYGEKHLDVAACYNNMANIFLEKKDFTKSLNYFEQALNIRLEILGESNPIVAESYESIGSFYHSYSRDYVKAMQNYEKALNIFLSEVGEQSTNVASCYLKIGLLYFDKGNFSKSLEFYEKALNIYLVIYGERNPNIKSLYNNIGAVYSKLGNHSKALEYSLKTLPICISIYGEKNRHVAWSYQGIMICYFNLRDYNNSLEYAKKYQKLSLELFGEISEDVGYSYYMLYYIYNGLGYKEKANECMQKSQSIQSKLRRK
ncbi:MAG: DUF2225 domain-containing protein [Muribaculaceae bacterium]